MSKLYAPQGAEFTSFSFGGQELPVAGGVIELPEDTPPDAVQHLLGLGFTGTPPEGEGKKKK